MDKFAGSTLSEYAKREAEAFLYNKETLLEPDYPCYAGYAYVLVSKDGEVKVIASFITGRAIQVLANMNANKPTTEWNWVEIRRCELVARMLGRSTESE